MSHTTDKMRETAGKIARLITERGQNIGCSECYVDDFGKFGNFSLILRLNVRKAGIGYKANNPNQFNLTKLVHLIKTVIKEANGEGAIYRSHECPQGLYSKQRIRNFTDSHFEGYERDYIQIDLDFIPYHAPSNTFAVQTEPVIVEQNPRGQQLNLDL